MLKKDRNMADVFTEEISAVPKQEKQQGWKIHHRLSGRKIPKLLLGIAFIALIGISIYYYHQYKSLKNDPNAVAQLEVKTVTAQVSKIMELPQGEDPTVATVSDEDKLKSQQFFQNAQNGDKILIYTGAKEAILYRPAANKIINVAPLVMDQNSDSQAAAANNQPASQNSPSDNQTAQVNASPAPPIQNSTLQPTDQSQNNNQPDSSNSAGATATSSDAQNSPLNVVIDNGSKTVGLASDTQNKLNGMNGISVVGTGNARKNNYTGTIVVDLTQKNTALLNQIAQAVGGQVGSLPDGETKPDNADVLIIAGK